MLPQIIAAVMHFGLPRGRIDVWTLFTDSLVCSIRALEAVLSADELQRANRFRFEHLRRNYVLSRGMLRKLCARYLDLDPTTVTFHYGGKGKPELSGDSNLRFNLSHSGELTVYAFARDLEIGIDVERIRTICELGAICERFFCPEEAAEVMTASEPERTALFHTCWTRKEAFIKVSGDGLSIPLNSFRVPLTESPSPHLIHINFDEAEGRRWTLHDLDLPPGYKGALCYRAPAHVVQVTPISLEATR